MNNLLEAVREVIRSSVDNGDCVHVSKQAMVSLESAIQSLDTAYQVHIHGPDDIEEYADELSALRTANDINKLYLRERASHPDEDVLFIGVVSPVTDSAGHSDG